LRHRRLSLDDLLNDLNPLCNKNDISNAKEINKEYTRLYVIHLGKYV
jgi:hypothetical protein